MSFHAERRGARRTIRRCLASGVGLVLLAGCGFDSNPTAPGPATAPGSTAASGSPAGLALAPAVTIPAVHIPGNYSVVAGSGSRFIISPEDTDEPSLFSPDDGHTWQPLPAALAVRADIDGGSEVSLSSHIGYQGVFAGVVQAADYRYTGLQRWDPDKGKVAFLPYDLDVQREGDDDTALYPVDYVGTVIALNDGRIFDISGDEARLLSPRFGATPKLYGLEYALTKDGATVVRAGYAESGEYGYLSVAPVDGSGEGANYRIPGLLAMDVSALKIHYLVGSTTGLTLCKADAATPTRSTCVKVASGDFRGSAFGASLTTSMGADQIAVSRHSGGDRRRWLLREGRATRVGTKALRWTWLPFRDSEEPMALVESAADHLTVASVVSRDGKAHALFSAPAATARSYGALLSPGRVTYQQQRYTAKAGSTWATWTRTFAGGALGAELALTAYQPARLVTSAGRSAAQLDARSSKSPNTVEFFRGNTRSLAYRAGHGKRLVALSGPYSLIGQDVVRVDGHEVETGPVVALFGSLVVEASAPDEVPGRTFAVRDVASPTSSPIVLDLPTDGRVYRNDDWMAWGDWVVAPYVEGDSYWQLALNYRTGDHVVFTGRSPIRALADGWALASDGSAADLRMLATGENLVVNDGPTELLATDGSHTIAWEDRAGTHLAEVKGLPSTPARLLGALGAGKLGADGTWTPQFDFTKAVTAGTVELRDAAGSLVASLPTAASPDGTVTGVSWDGTDAAGTRVAAGSYTWTFVVKAADGSGDATAVDGQHQPSGTVAVTS